MAQSATMAMLAAALCVLIHYELLRLITVTTRTARLTSRHHVLTVVAGALVAHLLEVTVFAAALWLLGLLIGPAALHASLGAGFEQALYVSIESYTSLGTAGDGSLGPIRLFAGIEALTGLLLIGWTTAFTYLEMRTYWDKP